MNTVAVIVTHNNERTIAECLDSIVRQGIRDIVVIDNASGDNTVDIVATYGVRVIRNKDNKGFGAAVNQGVKHIRDAISGVFCILLLNPDARLTGEIESATSALNTSSATGVAGLLLCDENGMPEKEGYGGEVTLYSLCMRNIYSGKTSKDNDIAWVSGGACVIRSDVFEVAEGFDPGYFMYWEDIDFCKRVRECGYDIVVCKDVPVVHDRGASLANRRKKARIYDNSADKYFRKHYSVPIWLTHRILRRIYRLFSPLSR